MHLWVNGKYTTTRSDSKGNNGHLAMHRGCRAASRKVKHLLASGKLAADVLIGSRRINALMKWSHREGNPKRYKGRESREGKRGILADKV